MTYFGFLLLFLGVPLAILTMIHLWLSHRHNPGLPIPFKSWSPLAVLFGHVVIAVAYTTPWDNYLVATNVWWYDPGLITGFLIGYVPIEEYTFFVVQTIFSGLFFWLLLRAWPSTFAPAGFRPNDRFRLTALAVVITLWLIFTLTLILNIVPLTYMSLILSWALFPIGIQIGFGADILWHYRRIVFTGIGLTTLYLSVADGIAIRSGTWTISPEQTINFKFFGILPFEEFLFFLVTNVLVIFGMTLVLARISHQRAADRMPVALKLDTVQP